MCADSWRFSNNGRFIPATSGTENALVESRMANLKRNRSWWLEDDGGICPACSQAYAYQTEYRCVACDGPVCAICVETRIEVEFICVDCVSANELAEAANA